MSTFDPSTELMNRLPAPLLPASCSEGFPESGVTVNELPSWRCSASGLAKVTTGTRAIRRVWPLSKLA